MSYRARINKVNEGKYVTFSKFYRDSKSQKWLPTKKHFYIPVTVWPSLFAKMSEINTALETTGAKGIFFPNLTFANFDLCSIC